ncbi:hypothetical protein [Martelella sp. HB161492]|uniref:hypothetical protein n=1 Tax=Martelella sp. HB161492 TaxID=2720726 RepID=UPI00158FD560|nr:hypothetical protein [Martelella sp. HB161492]
MAGLWNSNHNCYAYAMKCISPRGYGCNARPGKFAGQPVATGNFAAGVVNDGAAQNIHIEIVRFGGSPMPVPPRFTDGTYLVALLANNVGYHFLRRNEASGLWFHKNGASASPESWFVDFNTQRTHQLTDDVAGNLLQQPALLGCAMRFQAYLKVPDQGVQVTG